MLPDDFVPLAVLCPGLERRLEQCCLNLPAECLLLLFQHSVLEQAEDRMHFNAGALDGGALLPVILKRFAQLCAHWCSE